MISLDALGAKHMPCYGYGRDTSPNLCKFGNDNIFFQNAYSNASWTFPSHVSIFTSLYPMYHNVVGYGNVLSTKIPFLPEILQKNGYETYFYIPGDDTALPIKDVFSRGITKIVSEGYDDSSTSPYLDNALNSFLANVKSGKKTFVFLHTYYVHDPYLIGDREKIYTKDNFNNIPLSWEEYCQRPLTPDFYQFILNAAFLKKEEWIWNRAAPNFYENFKNAKTLKEAEKYLRSQDETWVSDLHYFYYSERGFNPNDKRQIEYLEALYDQKIHELDEWMGNVLIPFIKNPAIENNTMVIITSDHGEEFMEHGYMNHVTLYEPNVRVPLIVYIPGITHKKITSSVQGIDIVPTILEVVGISSKKFLFQGYSLVDLIQGNTKINRLLFAEGYYKNETKTIRKENWKLFLMKEADKYIPYELYDTELDPNELNNVMPSHMDIVNKMKKESDMYEEKWHHLLPFELISQ